MDAVAGYKQQIFESLGPSALGQASAAVVIGALSGLVAGIEHFTDNAIAVGICAAGGAGLGLVAALVLLVADYHRRRVAAGTSKPLSATFWVMATLVGMMLVFGISMVIALL